MRLASLLAVLVATLAPGSAATGQTYRVTGILSSSTTGVPIARGRLTVTLVDPNSRSGTSRNPSSTPFFETDERGRFMIPLSGPGEWRLAANARGFRSAALEEHDGYFTGVVITPALPSVDVALRLAPDASISGYVLDEAGEAVRTNGQVTLLMAAETLPDQVGPAWLPRGTTRTDDRGHYEFAGLASGRYQVMVQAQPWYAVAARRSAAPRQVEGAATPSDSPLDVAYPLTWYPGVTEPAAAGVLTLGAGDTLQADLRVLPVPSVHLRIPPAPADEGRGVNIPQLRLLTPTGTFSYQPVRPTMMGPGGVDIGGLAPGTYEVMLAGGDRQPLILNIRPGSARTLDLNTAAPTVSVAIHLDLPEETTPPAVRLIDVDTGRSFPSPRNRREGFLTGPLSSSDAPDMDVGARQPVGLRDGRRPCSRDDQTIDLPRGRYQVSLANQQSQYLIGMTATGAEISGRTVVIHGGTPQLTLRIGAGHATLNGFATVQDKADAGAMVLLVPATLGDPLSPATIRRAQTNTDGSFHVRDLTPGRYILVAIDHGWHVNWRDPATLNRYLVHGVPLDLRDGQAVLQSLEAQLP